MGAVAVRFRAEVAHRARSWVGLILLIGVAGGMVMATVGAARRTDSAYTRFLRAQGAADAYYGDDGENGLPPIDVAAVERLPEVVASARGAFGYLQIGQGLAFLAPADERYGSVIDRAKVLHGRLPRPDVVDEMAATFTVAERYGWKLGQRIPASEDPQYAELLAGAGLPRSFLIVGIIAAPATFPPFTNGSPYLRATPAFYRVYKAADGIGGTRPDSVAVRLRRGAADLPAFRNGLRGIAGESPLVLLQSGTDLVSDSNRSIHLQAEAVWLLAGFAALAALLILSQLLIRHCYSEAGENPALRALGFTRAQLWSVGMARLALLGVAAVIPAGLVATALSSLAPIGLGRTAEPHPGVAVDTAVLVVGAVVVALFPMLVGAFAAWRAARAPRTGPSAARDRPSRVAAACARAGLPPTAVAGSRLALEPPRGASRAAVRAAVAGVSLGVAALAAALTFGASLNGLISTPSRYGLRWDTYLTNYGAGPDWAPLAGPALATHPEVEAYTVGVVGTVDAGGRTVGFIAMGDHRGDAFPPVVAGSVPTAPDEVALAPRTMRQLGTHIGATLEMGATPESGRVTYRVVGRVVSPPLQGSRLGEGALMTLAGMQRIVAVAGDFPENYSHAGEALLRFAPGVDEPARRRVLSSLQAVVAPGGEANGESFINVPIDPPDDILNFGRVTALPFVLAGIVALLAVGTLAQFLIGGTRRRHRDLALLKTVGFVRSQIMATVAWEATILAVIALAVGIPAGVGLGRWLWTAFADESGVLSVVSVPLAAIVLVVPAALAVANLVAVVPARRAARLRPAQALRSE